VTEAIFIPGAAGSGAFWQPVMQRFATSWRVQSVDLPGLGSVAASSAVCSYDDLVDQVANRLHGPSVVVAQSMGAYIGLRLAIDYPHQVTHLVLTAATGGVDVARHGAADWRHDYAAAYPNAEPWACGAVPDLSGELHRVKVPALLIWATGDLLSPAAVGAALASKMAAPTLLTFESDDHWFVHQFAGETADAIRAFVEQNPPSQAR